MEYTGSVGDFIEFFHIGACEVCYMFCQGLFQYQFQMMTKDFCVQANDLFMILTLLVTTDFPSCHRFSSLFSTDTDFVFFRLFQSCDYFSKKQSGWPCQFLLMVCRQLVGFICIFPVTISLFQTYTMVVQTDLLRLRKN